MSRRFTSTANPVRRLQGTSKTRVNVVNPRLCDDVIKRLAPSLKQYIGGNVIDINPGPGLFSSKLYDFLRPRSHILFSPESDVFLPSLRPLLDAPGSRYHLRDWSNEDQWSPSRYVREGLIPDAEGRGGPPPTTKIPNNSTLIVANLAHLKSFIPETSRTGLFNIKALDFVHDTRHKTNFHARGPTRMLMWTLDSDKRTLLPRTVFARAKLAAFLEAECHVEEIVGFLPSTKGAQRETLLNIESSKRVSRCMAENKIYMPSNRRPTQLNDLPYLSDVPRNWHRELQELEEKFEARRLSQFVGIPPGPIVNRRSKGVKKDGRILSPEYSRMTTLRTALKAKGVKKTKLEGLLQKQAEIDKLDLEACNENISDKTREQMQEKMDTVNKDLKFELEKLHEKEIYSYRFFDDDRRALSMNPPLLMWDQRSAEPLIPEPSEFSNSKKLCLLDFQPKMSNQLPRMTSEQSLYFDMIATALLGSKAPKSLKSLNTVGPGAYEALVPHVAAIRDPRKGGRRDVDSVRVRTMTPEMLHGLAVAWDNWAFKPPLADVLTQYGMNQEIIARKGIA